MNAISKIGLHIPIQKLQIRLIYMLVFVFFFKNIFSILIPKQFFSALIVLIISGLYALIHFSSNRISKYDFFILYALISISAFSFFFPIKGWTIQYFVLSFIQIFIIVCSYRIVNYLPIDRFLEVLKLFRKLMIVFSVLGFVEFFIPTSIKAFAFSGYNKLVYGDFTIPVAYYLGDSSLSVLRIGSLFFEPVTFSFLTGLFFLYLLEHDEKKWFTLFVLVVHLMTMGKLALFCTFTALLFKYSHRYSYFLLCLIPLTVATYFVLSYSHIDVNMPSMANHVNGLISGFKGSLNNPFVGNGIGTSGFLVATASIDQLVSPFSSGTFIENGNESAIGILLFQFGFIFTLLFIGIFIIQMHSASKIKNYLYMGYTLGVIISLFFTESILGIVVIFIYLLLGKVTNEKRKNIYC